MRKLLLPAATTVAVGILTLGTMVAQTTPASTTKPATAANSSATGATAKTSTTAKPKMATAATTPKALTLNTQKEKLSYAIGMNIGQSMKKDSLDIDQAILTRAIKDVLTSDETGTTSTKPSTAGAGIPARSMTLTTEKDKISYAIGMNIGAGMKKDDVDVDPNILAQGLKDAMTGSKTMMTEAEAKEVITKLRTEMTAKKQAATQQKCTTHGPQERHDWDVANAKGTPEAYIAFRAKYPDTACVRILSGEISSSMGLDEGRMQGSVSVNGERVEAPSDVAELVRLGLMNGGGSSVSAKTIPNARLIMKKVGDSWKVVGVAPQASSKTLMTEAEAKDTITKLRNDMVAKRQAELQKAGEANKTAGQQFLAANKTKEGVVTLPSGLQYKIIKQGDGPKPTASDTVVTNYRGTLIDGTEFDSSYKRNDPATFPVGQVIKGWTEALELMPVGSKWQLFIPSNLAYGERSPGPEIAPNSTLVFDIELLSIQDKKAADKQ